MSAYLIIGLPGSGKSLVSAKIMMGLLRRNINWYKKTGKIRYVYSNLKVSEKWKNGHLKANEFVKYWENPMELVGIEDVDIVWDEIARHIDSRDWGNLNPKLKRFIQEQDKVGIDIYANTQSPMQVDVMFRRNCEQIWRVSKLCGSRRPSPTRIPSRIIWGICYLRKLERVSFGKEEDQEEFEPNFWAWPHLRWIDPKTCNFFDTRQKIPYNYPPLEHIKRNCPKCGLEHIKHQ